MESKVIEESQAAGTPISVDFDGGNGLFYFKLVGIGPNTMQETENQPLSKVQGVPGYLIVGSPDEIRENLHAFVDRAVDAWQGAQNGSTE